MAIIPVLEAEEKIQLNDKTRFNGVKSFVTKGATAISTMTVTIGATVINIFDSEVSNRFGDWAHTAWTFDIDSTNNKIYFSENSVDLVATVASATYATLASLLTAIQTALNAASSGYTLTLDEKNRITMTKSNGTFIMTSLRKDAALLPHIGFYLEQKTALAERQGTPVEFGFRKVVLTVGDGTTTATKNFYQKVYSVEGDALFSNDSDLIADEPDIMNWVPDGRATFLNVHRKAQERIMNYLDKNGYTDTNQIKLSKFAIIDNTEVNLWSKYLALQLLMESNHNSVDDVFEEKAKAYEKLALDQAQRLVLRMDIDGDGSEDPDLSPSISTGEMFRR